MAKAKDMATSKITPSKRDGRRVDGKIFFLLVVYLRTHLITSGGDWDYEIFESVFLGARTSQVLRGCAHFRRAHLQVLRGCAHLPGAPPFLPLFYSHHLRHSQKNKPFLPLFQLVVVPWRRSYCVKKTT